MFIKTNLLEISIRIISKVAGYQVNMEKLTEYLHINNKYKHV